MFLRRTAAYSGALLLSLCASHALAGQYDANMLGTSVPNWAETLSSVNSDGDVAWSQLSGEKGSKTESMLTWDGAASLQLANLPGQSVAVAVNLSERKNNEVWVVGSGSTSNSLTNRQALIWRVGLGAVTSPAPLNLALTTLPLGPAGASIAPQQSFAYGLAKIDNGWLVAGSARAQVSRDSFPQPTLWRVTTGAEVDSIASASILSMNAEATNGVVRDIAERPEGGFWACGNESGEGAYSMAVCWQLDADGEEVTGQRRSLDLGVSNVVTSVVNRVRTVRTGPNPNDKETVAVGFALAGGHWIGWAYNLSSDALISKDFGLDVGEGAIDAMVFDVAGLNFLDSPAARYGMMFGGMSATLSNHGNGIGEPSAATPLRGTERRMLFGATVDNGQVCSIRDDSVGASATGSNYEQVIALSADGSYRVVRAGEKLVRLNMSPNEPTVRISVRHANTRVSETGSSASAIYYDASVSVDGNAGVTKGVLRLANALGCSAVSESAGMSTSCGSAMPAAFDIAGAGFQELELTLNAAGTALVGRKQNDNLLPVGKFDYAQVATNRGGDCVVTPVYAATKIEYNPPTDYATEKSWDDCIGGGAKGDYVYGNETDTSVSYDHCGACTTNSTFAHPDNHSVDDHLSCTTNSCVGGSRHAVASGGAGSGCWVHSANHDWGTGICVPHGVDNTKRSSNPCRRCDEVSNPSDWITQSAPDEGYLYRCQAHHNNHRVQNNAGAVTPGFFYDGHKNGWTCQSSHTGTCIGRTGFRFEADLEQYRSNHLCTANYLDNDDTRTRNGETSPFWDRVSIQSLNGGVMPNWPGDFFQMPWASNSRNWYGNTGEVRSWLWQYPFTYLGQLNPSWESSSSHYNRRGGHTYYTGWQASAFELKPDETRWFVFYYNDQHNEQDRLGVLTQFDDSSMDLEVELHFVCGGKTGIAGRPRMDGIRACSAAGRRDSVTARSTFDVRCGKAGRLNESMGPYARRDGSSGSPHTHYGRYSSCIADKAAPVTALPWRTDDNSIFGRSGYWKHPFHFDETSTWKNAQGGIYVEGHLDCDARNADRSLGNRRGWAFVRVKRKNTPGKDNPNICTPITLRPTVFYPGIGFTSNAELDVCWTNSQSDDANYPRDPT